MDCLNVALVGCGAWGVNILRNLVDQVGPEAVTVCDPNPEALATAWQIGGSLLGGAVGDLGAAMRVPSGGLVDAVMIATPPDTHYDLARMALDAGAHVFVEKPLTLTLAMAEDLVEVANEASRVLMVGHLLRYHPNFIRVLEMVRRGEMGRLEYAYAHRLNLGKVRPGENVLWSFAPHDLSMLLALAGDRLPETVHCQGAAYLQADVPDVTATLLDWGDGLKAHVFVSWLNPVKERRLTVVGEQGMLVFRDDKGGAALVHTPYRVEAGVRAPVPVAGQAAVIPSAAGEPLAAEVAHFLACCRTGARPRTDGAEALRVLRVLDAAQRSLETGQPVTLAEATAWWAHPLADVEAGAEIGAGTKIWRWTHIMAGAWIGPDVMIGQGCHVGPDVVIGEGCRVQNGVNLYDGVVLEPDVFVGPGATFTNVRRPRAGQRGTFEPTVVEQGATIGANATIRCGVRIGAGALVGAGAVVTRDVAPGAEVAGVPARERT